MAVGVVGTGRRLTIGEMATILDVSDTTARAYADAGKVRVGGVDYPLDVKRLGTHRRVLAEDVEQARHALYGDAAEGPGFEPGDHNRSRP